MTKKMIAPSLLAANFANLAKEIEMVNTSDADFLHLDIMDGVFVPNISFGIPVLTSLLPLKKKPFDVHLMIEHPELYVESFKKAGADIYNFHAEACRHQHRLVELIRQNEMQPGITLNPHTPVSVLEDIISELDLVLIMSVNPGFGGQKFIENSYSKIARLKELILKKNSGALIEVDGGVDGTNSAKLYEAGADVLVSGSYLFGSNDPHKAIREMKK